MAARHFLQVKEPETMQFKLFLKHYHVVRL